MKRFTPVPIMSVFLKAKLGPFKFCCALRAKLLYKGSQIGIGRALQFYSGGPPSGQRFCSNGRPISSLFIYESAVRVTVAAFMEAFMHVISASRRTDIPAFHADWLMRRIRTGSARVVSPFGGGVHEVSLTSEDVIAIVFWTKNAVPLIPYLDELAALGHCFTFLYSINNYPAFLEPKVPDRGQTLRAVELLVRRLYSVSFQMAL